MRPARIVAVPVSAAFVRVVLVASLLGTACGGDPPEPAAPAPRRLTELAGPWRFHVAAGPIEGQSPALDDSGWAEVRVPHTWGRDFHHHGWYRTRLAHEPRPGRRTYLGFDGVASIADVYVNGRHVGQHNGAYTRFVFDVTDALVAGENLVAVHVTNHPKDTVDSLPSGASKMLYWPYGGIYRKAWRLETGAEHVDPTDHASAGVYVTPTGVSADGADLKVRTLVRNASDDTGRYEVHHRLIGPDGTPVTTLTAETTVPPGERGETVATGRVSQPKLWGPGHPHLYTLVTELRKDGAALDSVTVHTGFRDIRMSDDGQFLLNGEPILLRGVGKHQETEDDLAAISDDDMREDFQNLRDLGVNIVRLAHYPHAPLEYTLADQHGILVWAENGHSNPYKVGPIGEVITREMVRQLYNHPSIVMWSVGNENAYLRVPGYAALVREEDPTRLVTYASNTGARLGKRYGDLDFIAHNTYRGWYRGHAWEFVEKALAFRYVAESGGGEVITNHMEYVQPNHVVNVFEPEEYRQLLAEVHFQTVFRDHPRQIPLYLVWILRDFSIDKYKDRWNTKGLLTYSSFRKDSFYLYQSFLRPDHPVVHITSKPWFLRDEVGIKAYSNRSTLRLVLNGEERAEQWNGEYAHRNGRRINNVFFWRARLRPGRNEVKVTDGEGHEDTAVIYGRGRAEPDPADPVRDVRSSNSKSPATFIRMPVEPQWPFYAEFDGTADNTFDVVPARIAGASWIATRRLSKPAARTDLAFTTTRPVEVLIASADEPALSGHFRAAGFTDTGERGRWRTNDLVLQPFAILARSFGAGETVEIPGTTGDYVVLVR